MQNSNLKNQNVGSNFCRGKNYFLTFARHSQPKRLLRRSRQFSILHFDFERKRTGFTIIELLVVLAIIAMIASAALALFSQVRLKARDATREQNIKTVQTALNLYATTARTYPVSSAPGPCSPLPPANCSNIASCGEQINNASLAGSALVQSGSTPSVPTDPINQGNYKFYYASNGLTYALSYCLETDSIPQKSAGLNQATP